MSMGMFRPKASMDVYISYKIVKLLSSTSAVNRARQLYKHMSMLFLFPVKDGKLSTGVNATFNASCYG